MNVSYYLSSIYKYTHIVLCIEYYMSAHKPNLLKFPTQQQTLGRPLWHSYQLIYVALELYHFRIPAGSSLERTSQLSPSEYKKSEKLWDFHRIALSIGCVEMTSRSAASHLHGELCSDRIILYCIGGCFVWIKCWVQRGMSYVCLCWCQNYVWILLGCQNCNTCIHI